MSIIVATQIINNTYKFVNELKLSPDILIAADNNALTMYSNCFHELSHYSHAIKRGSGFWSQVVYAESYNNIYFNDPYYNGQYPDATYASRIGLAESWAFFMEEMISNYYGFTYYQHPTTIDNFQPYTIPYTTQDERKNGWIPVGLYWDLIDNTPSELIILNNNNNVEEGRGYDNFNGNSYGITINKLYNILIQPDCNKITDFKSNFITLFPTASSSINSLFNVYGY